MITSKHYILSFFLFIFIIALNYCIKNDDVELMAESELCECHNNISWNPLKISNHLLGSWVSNIIKYPKNIHKSIDSSTYQLDFISGSKLIVYKNGLIEKKTRWSINEKQNYYIIKTEPYIEKVHGRILFCENKLIIENNIKNGEKFYFSKKGNKN